jgi:hypothetical protein
MRMKKNSEPTRTTPIFISCAASFFSHYKYRQNKRTVAHNLFLFFSQVHDDKIKKSTMHDISFISNEHLESVLSDEKLKQKDTEKDISLFINNYNFTVKDPLLRL